MKKTLTHIVVVVPSEDKYQSEEIDIYDAKSGFEAIEEFKKLYPHRIKVFDTQKAKEVFWYYDENEIQVFDATDKDRKRAEEQEEFSLFWEEQEKEEKRSSGLN